MTALEQFKLEYNVSEFLNKEASGAIRSYLNEQTPRTKTNYTLYFNDFFKEITKCNIDTVTWNEIVKIEHTDVAAYQKYLQKKIGNKNQTVNQKMGAIKKLFEFLKEKYPQFNINTNNTTVRRLKESKHDVESFDVLFEDEAYALFDFCETVNYKPQSQRLFFETMFNCCLRFDAVRTLTTENIHHIIDPLTRQMVYVIKVIDKSKDREIAIPDEFAQKLLDEPKNNDIVFKINNPTRIFEFGDQSLRNTLEKFCKESGIENRKIKLHSVKKAAVDYGFNFTGGDTKAVAEFAGHSDVNTTLRHYANQQKTYFNQISMKMGTKAEDGLQKLEELSKDDLIALIKKAGNSTIQKLVDTMKIK